MCTRAGAARAEEVELEEMSSSKTTDGLLRSEQEWVVVGVGCLTKKSITNKNFLLAISCFVFFVVDAFAFVLLFSVSTASVNQ